MLGILFWDSVDGGYDFVNYNYAFANMWQFQG